MAHEFSRHCPECGAGFVTAHGRKFFCSVPCQKAWGNRDLAEGFAIIGLAKAWRLGRNVKGKDEASLKLKELAASAFMTFCRKLDESNTTDREAGRLSALKMLAKRHAHDLIDLI